MRSSSVSAGKAPAHAATAPATNGAAIEVPECRSYIASPDPPYQ